MHSTTLEPLIRSALTQVPRIELLKLDVRGYEWPCILGAGKMLDKVDNIFVEVQDVPKDDKKMMYFDSVGSRTSDLANMDANLEKLGFVRQYCETNSPRVREFNCLYTKQGQHPIWVTGRPQGKGLAVNNDTSAAPKFKGTFYISPLKTSRKPGALDDLLPVAAAPDY